MDENKIAPGKRSRLKVSSILAILLLICIGIFAYHRLSIKSKLQVRIDAIRAAGYPVTCAELDKWYTIPENVENAADAIIDAFWSYREMGEIKSLPFIGQAKLPAYQRKKASEALGARLASLSHVHVFIHMLMPALSRITAIEIRSIAGLRAAQAGLAVERYRLAAGKLPDSLSELVPTYLESVPKDPFDGKELRYKKLEAGFVVYSICEDLIDDGGKEKTKESKNWDITFMVER